MEENSKEYEQGLQFEKLTKILSDTYKNPKLDIDKWIDQIKIAEQFSLDSKRILCLFSHPEFSFKYVSQNIEKEMGFSPDEVTKGGLALGLKLLHWKQLLVATKIFQWGEKVEAAIKDFGDNTETIAFYCGVKFKNNQGILKTFFFKQKILTYDKNTKQPLLSYMEIDDISSIYKGDFVWNRTTAKNETKSYTRAFFSKGRKKEYADLLSERELEILRLITQLKNNIEISEILGIAKNTVERHRKNMIARVGVTDMTGLIYVCRLCQLI